jgi:hypothetical protein
MKKLILNIILVLASTFVFAQTAPVKKKTSKVPIYSIFQEADADKVTRENSLGKEEENCAPKLPVVKSDDVIFAKRVIRDIYFADPANRYLAPSVMDRNIIDILLKGVETNMITGYQNYDRNINRINEPIDTAANALKTYIDSKVGAFTAREYGDLKGGLGNLCLRVVEDWYFDTNRSEFKSFISTIGLMYAGNNVLLSLNNDDKKLADPSIKLGETGSDMSPIFYVNYPTVRDYLCKFRVFHPNEKIRYSFDDVFQLRYFSSLIIEESNVDGLKLADRPDLKSGLDKLLEADRIKKSLIQYEQDMWQH